MAFCIRQTLNTVRTIRVPSVLGNRSFRMSAKLRAEQALEDLQKKNPYFEKYAGKIAALQKQSPEEFLSRLDSVDKTQNTKETKEKPRFVSTYFSISHKILNQNHILMFIVFSIEPTPNCWIPNRNWAHHQLKFHTRNSTTSWKLICCRTKQPMKSKTFGWNTTSKKMFW